MKLRHLFLPVSLTLSLLIPFARPAAQEGVQARRARVEMLKKLEGAKQ